MADKMASRLKVRVTAFASEEASLQAESVSFLASSPVNVGINAEPSAPPAHEQEERLADAVGGEEGVQFGRCAEGARDDDTARQPRDLTENDGEHHRPRRAGDLFVG
jgi:hypothetical protein